METLQGFAGPYSFDAPTVSSIVTRERSPGTIVLGCDAGAGKLQVRYVGRSDTDLRELLTKLVTEAAEPAFLFRYAESAQEAFETECKLFHAHRQEIVNPVHPIRPEWSSLRCPVCHVLS